MSTQLLMVLLAKVFSVELNPLAQTNPSAVVSNADLVSTSTKTVTKTIDATGYVQTVSYSVYGARV